MAAALLRNNCLMYNLKINYCRHDYYKLIVLKLLTVYIFNLNLNKNFIEFGYCIAEILWGQFRSHHGTMS